MQALAHTCLTRQVAHIFLTLLASTTDSIPIHAGISQISDLTKLQRMPCVSVLTCGEEKGRERRVSIARTMRAIRIQSSLLICMQPCVCSRFLRFNILRFLHQQQKQQLQHDSNITKPHCASDRQHTSSNLNARIRGDKLGQWSHVEGIQNQRSCR